LIKASQPAPIKYNTSKFAGEICPICNENRLVAALKYPVCIRCRQRFSLTENLLKKLKSHRLIIDQETIDWEQKPHPTLTGVIDDIGFKASYVLNRWFIQFATTKYIDKEFLASLIKQYLDQITSNCFEQVKTKPTKIRRYFFFVAIGTTVVTATYLFKKRAERSKTKQTKIK